MFSFVQQVAFGCKGAHSLVKTVPRFILVFLGSLGEIGGPVEQRHCSVGAATRGKLHICDTASKQPFFLAEFRSAEIANTAKKIVHKLFLRFHSREPGLLNSRKTEMTNGIMPVVFHAHLCRSLFVVPGAWVPNPQMPKALLRNANASTSLGWGPLKLGRLIANGSQAVPLFEPQQTHTLKQ